MTPPRISADVSLRGEDAPAAARRAQGLGRRAVSAALCAFALALPLSIAGANIGWVLLLAALSAYRWSTGALPFDGRRSAIEKPLWLFLAASIVSAAFGVDPRRSFSFLYQDAHKVWLYTVLAVGLSVAPARAALAFLAAGFCCAALLGVGQSLMPVPPGDIARAHAFVHPATYGEQMSVAVLGALCFLLRPPSDWNLTPRRKTLLAAFAALLIAALFLSHTRGAILACAGGFMAVCALAPGLRRWAALCMLAAAAAFMASELYFPGRSVLAELLGWRKPLTPESGQFMRFYLWDVAVQMGLDHLWTGVGTNNFRALFPRYFAGSLDGHAQTWGTAHNLYLHHFAERGLLGLCALGAFLGAFWLRALERARKSPDAWHLWAFGTATAFLLMNLTEVALQTEILWMLVFFVWVWSEVIFKERQRS